MIAQFEQRINSITMYRLVLYGLSALAGISVLFGLFGWVPFSGIALIVSLAVCVGSCFALNTVFAKFAHATTNVESAYVTGFILFFLLTPPSNVREGLAVVIAAAIAMGSKYLIAVHKRHVFNPAAIAAVVLGLFGSPLVSWWVGSKPLLVPVLVVGLVVVARIRKFTLVWSFLAASTVVSLVYAMKTGTPIPDALSLMAFSFPTIFFATIMLTEPLTSPSTQGLRVGFGALVGVLFSTQFHIGPLFSTPELALVIGNVFSFFTSRQQRVALRLLEQRELAPELYEFVVEPDRRLVFQAGQYIEWTLPHANPDSRGIRRYFTISSPPTEHVLRFGVRIGERVSSFKTALKNLSIGGVTYASHLMGDFVLPKDPNQKLIFIAGGIGITPFRSMIQFLVDTKERRDIVLLYACASSKDFAYMDVFENARRSFGLKTVQIVTDADKCEPGFHCRIGFVDEKLLAEEAPDFHDRKFYLSGPVAMVKAYKQLLLSLSIQARNIVTDYFPGF